MRICHKHEDSLRVALSEAGLDRYINCGNADLDPMLLARYAISINSLTICGPKLLIPDQNDKLPCPLCYLRTNVKCEDPKCNHEHGPADQDWIKFAVEEQSKRFAANANHR